MLLHVIIFAIVQTFECPGYDSMWKYLRYFYIMLSVKIKIRKHFSSTIAAQCLSFENKCTLTIGVAWSSDCNFPLFPLKFWLSDNQIYCFHGYQTIDLLFPWPFVPTCSLYWLMSSKDFVLLTAKTHRKPSPVLMYWSRIALKSNLLINIMNWNNQGFFPYQIIF